MRRREKYDARRQLIGLGIAPHHADRLLRISNALRRWHELECGTADPREPSATVSVERAGEDGDGKPFRVWRGWAPAYGQNGRTMTYQTHRHPIRDMETSSLRSLKAIMAVYEKDGLGYYVQGDPRGCALYILRPGDVPAGADPSAYYSRGIAVYKE